MDWWSFQFWFDVNRFTFAPLVTLDWRYVYTKLQISSASILRKTKAPDGRTDRQTGGVQHLMRPPREGRIVALVGLIVIWGSPQVTLLELFIGAMNLSKIHKRRTSFQWARLSREQSVDGAVGRSFGICVNYRPALLGWPLAACSGDGPLTRE